MPGPGGVCLVRGGCLPGPRGGQGSAPGGYAWSGGGLPRDPPCEQNHTHV